MRPCPPLPDLPSISALLCVLSRFLFAAAVFACRLSACGHGRPRPPKACGRRAFAPEPSGNVRSGEGGEERRSRWSFRADSGGRGEQREVNATPGWFGSGPGGLNSAQEGH